MIKVVFAPNLSGGERNRECLQRRQLSQLSQVRRAFPMRRPIFPLSRCTGFLSRGTLCAPLWILIDLLSWWSWLRNWVLVAETSARIEGLSKWVVVQYFPSGAAVTHCGPGVLLRGSHFIQIYLLSMRVWLHNWVLVGDTSNASAR